MKGIPEWIGKQLVIWIRFPLYLMMIAQLYFYVNFYAFTMVSHTLSLYNLIQKVLPLQIEEALCLPCGDLVDRVPLYIQCDSSHWWGDLVHTQTGYDKEIICITLLKFYFAGMIWNQIHIYLRV